MFCSFAVLFLWGLCSLAFLLLTKQYEVVEQIDSICWIKDTKLSCHGNIILLLTETIDMCTEMLAENFKKRPATPTFRTKLKSFQSGQS